MKPVNKDFNYKQVVRQGYDECAQAYMEARKEGDISPLSLLFAKLPEGGRVLDLGCGCGLPIAKKLAEKFQVTGVDISPGQIELARKNVPGGDFLCLDICDFKPEPESFEAIVSFYALFHMPQSRQKEVLSTCARWLKPGGYLLFTIANQEEAPYTEDFFGTTMYWTSYSPKAYRLLLGELGFEVLKNSDQGHGYDEDYQGQEESHLLILARKRAAANKRRINENF